ncbi:hypothetical protein BJ742DRAFT_777832 [Cladochytrium replicatum]|nr:hypothetical protein BJ742DRAFT_777832 [Cladochytrium replicatum]
MSSVRSLPVSRSTIMLPSPALSASPSPSPSPSQSTPSSPGLFSKLSSLLNKKQQRSLFSKRRHYNNSKKHLPLQDTDTSNVDSSALTAAEFARAVGLNVIAYTDSEDDNHSDLSDYPTMRSLSTIGATTTLHNSLTSSSSLLSVDTSAVLSTSPNAASSILSASSTTSVAYTLSPTSTTQSLSSYLNTTSSLRNTKCSSHNKHAPPRLDMSLFVPPLPPQQSSAVADTPERITSCTTASSIKFLFREEKPLALPPVDTPLLRAQQKSDPTQTPLDPSSTSRVPSRVLGHPAATPTRIFPPQLTTRCPSTPTTPSKTFFPSQQQQCESPATPTPTPLTVHTAPALARSSSMPSQPTITTEVKGRFTLTREKPASLPRLGKHRRGASDAGTTSRFVVVVDEPEKTKAEV